MWLTRLPHGNARHKAETAMLYGNTKHTRCMLLPTCSSMATQTILCGNFPPAPNLPLHDNATILLLLLLLLRSKGKVHQGDASLVATKAMLHGNTSHVAPIANVPLHGTASYALQLHDKAERVLLLML